MLRKITKKEYTTIMWRRKLSPKEETVFAAKAEDGNYYKSTNKRGKAAKELYEYNKVVKASRRDQLQLFDL